MVPSQVLNQIVQATRGTPVAGFTLETPTSSTGADGARTTRTAVLNPVDLAIRMGAWELRLLPTPAGTDPTLRVPVELVEEADGTFRSLAVEVGRLELVADPQVLVPGTLVAEPFQHIVAVGNSAARVRLFGPGLKLRFSGADFSDFAVEVTGAEGATTPALPSLRFDPPHFLIGDGVVGIACDEAVLDLRDDVSPPNVPVAPGSSAAAWTGLFLKELGVFINNGSQPGSGDWAGNAVLRNFFMGFDPLEISGNFRAELIHLVADVDPQVVIAITHPVEGGGSTTNSSSDVAVPAPPAGSASQRVELVATASWDSVADAASGSLRAHWTVPATAHVEDPYRVDRMNLGAVLLPPGSHSFSLAVHDDRLPEGQRDKLATRVINVAGVPTTGADARPLTLSADAQRTLTSGDSPRQRLQMGVSAGQTFQVNGVARAGSGPVSFALVLPSGLTTTSPNPSGVARNGSGAAEASWTVTAGSTAGDFVLEVTATAGSETARHRIRCRVEAAASPSAPEFDLSSYVDARPDAGVVQALVEVRNGVTHADITWSLEERAAPADLFTSAAHDGLFTSADTSFTPTGLLPTMSGDAVRAFLPEARLYRLTGSKTSAATARPPVVISSRDLRSTEGDRVRNAASSLADTPLTPAAGGADFLFPYDATTIQPTAIARSGPEHSSLRVTAPDICEAQQAALAALYRAVLEDPSAVVAIHVFGQASVEGDEDYNLDLADRRAAAAKAEITGSGPLAIAAATRAGSNLTAVQAALAGKTLSTHTFGESCSHTVYIPETGRQSVDPTDRRVFFVIERASTTASALVRREYFLVRADAEVVPSPVRPPTRPLQDHPFRHNCFRKATMEIELLRNRIMKLQVVLVLDLEAFNENDADPRELNDADGITTFFLEYKENPAPGTGEPRFSWELAALADPRDADGLVAANDAGVRQALGGPLLTVPAITAVSGGEIGAGAFIAAATVGAILSGLSLLTIDFLCLSGVRLRVRYGNDAGTELRFAVDYKMKYRITVDLQQRLGIPIQLITEQPIEIGFRNVGVEIREGRDVKFFYKPAEGFALDVRDPGIFQLGEGLGRLLRVDRVRLGAGSPLWFEVELGFAFETGIFSVDTLRIRVSFDSDKLFPTSGDVTLIPGGFSFGDFDVSINKLGVSVDVPGVLAGSGVLEMTNDAGALTVAGAVDVDVVPLKFGVSAGAKFVSRTTPTPLTAFFGSLGVEFSPGLPLGTTGVALQGLEGLLGVNMGRSMPAPEQALPWYMQSPIGATSPDKWVANEGRWAVGAGAVLGTVYDGGFTFNLKGLFLLELPGPKFTLAANANLIKPPPSLGAASEQGTIAALVMLDFENDVFLIGLDFRYTIPSLLDLHVPVEAFFNLRSSRDWHIRFGQWEPASKRISIRVLNLWNASGYIQIEGDRLQNSKLDLLGPAVGLGSRVEINWGARPVVWFEAFLEWHVGVQFKPLLVMGSIEVGGSLHLGPFSIGGRGLLTVRAPTPLLITGEVCGEIDFWLFSISGCASISIGGGDPTPPAPESPFADLAIIDRWTDRVLSSVTGPTLVSDVPIDALLHLNFTSDVRDERATPASAAFSDTWRNQVSSELFYEFGLSSLTLLAGTATVTGFDQTWPGLTLPDKTGPAAQEAKAHRTLRLFSWFPSAHARAVDFTAGYDTTTWEVLKGLCDPTPPPRRRCLTVDEEPLGYRPSWTLTDCALHPSWIIQSRTGGLGSEALQNAYGLYPARVVPLPGVTWQGQAAKEKVVELGPGTGRFGLPNLLPSTSYAPTVTDERPRLDPRVLMDRLAIGKLLDTSGILRRPSVELRPAAGALEVHPVGLRPVLARPGARPLLGGGGERPRVEPTPEVGPVAGLFPEEALIAKSWHVEKESVLGESLLGHALGRSFVEAKEEGASLGDAVSTLNQGKETAPLSKSATSSVLGFYVAGLLWVAVDDLIEATAHFLVPERITDGEVVFLDGRLQPIGHVFRLRDAATVPSSSPAGYRVVSVSQTVDPDPKRKKGIRWMVILPPSRARDVVSFAMVTHVTPKQSPLGPSYFLQLCGRTWDEWKQWFDREQDRLSSLSLFSTAGGIGGANPGGLDGELLQPDTEYRLRIALAWRRYASASGAENGSGSFGDVEIARFRTAREAPADLGPYIASHEPASDEQPHYTGEGLRFDFRTKSVDELWRRFGKQLVVRAKADLGGEFFIQPVDSSGGDGFVEIGSPEWAWNRAMSTGVVPCLLDTTVETGSTVTTSKPLSPNTGYTVSVHARPLSESTSVASEAEWDERLLADLANDGAADSAKNRVVYRFALKTSRYAGFAAHVDAYRTQTPMDPVSDGTGSLPTTSKREDAAVDALCLSLFGGPLELPQGPEVLRLWRASPSTTPYGTPTFTLLGVLLDGPEPLLRLRGDGSVRVSVQVSTGPSFDPSRLLATTQIVGARGARVFLLFTPPAGTTLVTLRFTDLGPAGTTTTTQDLVIPVGALPAAYQE